MQQGWRGHILGWIYFYLRFRGAWYGTVNNKHTWSLSYPNVEIGEDVLYVLLSIWIALLELHQARDLRVISWFRHGTLHRVFHKNHGNLVTTFMIYALCPVLEHNP